MKKLILMRHAKSDWSKQGQRDKDRTLNTRGRLAASLMGEWLRDQKHLPQTAMVSSAVRTRETWDGMKLDADVQFLDELYLAEADDYIACAQSGPECDCLLVLGHNPGMETAMGLLAGRRMSAATAATAVFSFPVKTWREVEAKLGTLEAFETPKSLV